MSAEELARFPLEDFWTVSSGSGCRVALRGVFRRTSVLPLTRGNRHTRNVKRMQEYRNSISAMIAEQAEKEAGKKLQEKFSAQPRPSPKTKGRR